MTFNTNENNGTVPIDSKNPLKTNFSQFKDVDLEKIEQKRIEEQRKINLKISLKFENRKQKLAKRTKLINNMKLIERLNNRFFKKQTNK